MRREILLYARQVDISANLPAPAPILMPNPIAIERTFSQVELERSRTCESETERAFYARHQKIDMPSGCPRGRRG